MTKSAMLLSAAAVLLLAGTSAVQAQPATGQDEPRPGQRQMAGGMGMGGMNMDPEMMQRMMERCQGMMPGQGMRQGMMGGGMRAPGAMMRAMFALMDADGNGALSRAEFLEAHSRIFAQLDADGSDSVTLEDMLAFLQGPLTGPDDDLPE